MKNDAVNKYGELIDSIIKDNIYTFDSLKSSPYYNDFFICSQDIAVEITNIKKHTAQTAKAFMAWDDCDLVSEMRDKIINSFETQVKKTLEKGKSHNHLNYLLTIFDNNIVKDSLKKFEVRKRVEFIDESGNRKKKTEPITTTDKDGINHKLYHKIEYLSTPITNNDDSLTLGDTIQSMNTPLDYHAIIAEFDNTYSQKLIDDLKKLSNHKYHKQLYVYITDILTKQGLPNTLDYSIRLFQKNNLKKQDKAQSFIKAYNKDLRKFYSCLNKNVKNETTMMLIHSLLAHSIKDFGNDFELTMPKVYHLRNLNKKEVENTNVSLDVVIL